MKTHRYRFPPARLPFGLLLAGLALACQPLAAETEQLQLPPGFSATVYADDVRGARQMAWGANGTLFVGSMRAGLVHAVRDRDGDGRAESNITIARDLTLPSGLAFHDGTLYIGAVSTIYRVPNAESLTGPVPKPPVLTDKLPTKTHHGWKYLGIAPDGSLFVPVGAPCNVCLERDPRFGSILKMDRRTGATTVFAHGVRNSVGFDWHPRTGVLWFTDNGRDMMGDDIPADELNRAATPGQHFGFPHVHQGDLLDPAFGAGHQTDQYVAPAHRIQAHAAAVGVAFYSPDRFGSADPPAAFPAAYHNALFVAEHGSWNRTSKVGYQVSVALIRDGGVIDYRPFLTGFLDGERAWGRPSDVAVGPDGALYVADDHANRIYRITYAHPAVTASHTDAP